MELCEIVKKKFNKELKDCSNEEIYVALLGLINAMAEVGSTNKKKLYYVSNEFLIGRLLSNNLINLGIYDEIKTVLEENGKNLNEIEEIEPEPSLGNGGLGRLAACFLDSLASMGLCGDGIGLNYHFGLFKQRFVDNKQDEQIDPWITNDSWLIDTDKTYTVKFRDFSVRAKMYDINVIGYKNRTNRLHLFDIESVDESIVGKGISFDKRNIKQGLTLFLYPDDKDTDGKLLRIYQQYFMVSCAARLIIDECIQRGSDLHNLADFAVIQINDTHPTMIIPELIRQLTERGIDECEAIEITSKICAYTNHTILAEALEKWPLDYLQQVSPEVVSIIKKLDEIVKEKHKDEVLHIIDSNNIVRMANIDIHFCFSVNGVALLHTEILKNNELKSFYEIYPQKFNNKTNGITLRRWLLHCNPKLAELVSELIGDGYKTDANQLKGLLEFKDNKKTLERLREIKHENKCKLKDYLKKTQNITVDENAIFDIQIKRLHEYKRQQLNALYLIDKYLRIKNGECPKLPICAVFGAKAAPAYTLAKDIIHLILCLGEIIAQDAQVSKYLKVVMVENYNVSLAEKLIPAADISEQISLASKEASGTGNMKLMLNGAVTIGTEDGANVEIHRLVGDENIYVFGADSSTVVERYKKGTYAPMEYYKNDDDLKAAVDFITSPQMLSVGDKECLNRLKNELLNKDWFMTFPDFKDYVKTKEKAFADYEDRENWSKKMLVNIANAGYFSSDRTIEEYNREIWHLN